MAEILPGGQVRYTTTIADPASSLNGRSVSVSYTEGVPCDGGVMRAARGLRGWRTWTPAGQFRRQASRAAHRGTRSGCRGVKGLAAGVRGLFGSQGGGELNSYFYM